MHWIFTAVCGEQGLHSSCAEAASRVAEHRLQGVCASGVVALGPENTDSLVLAHRPCCSAGPSWVRGQTQAPCTRQVGSFPGRNQGRPNCVFYTAIPERS